MQIGQILGAKGMCHLYGIAMLLVAKILAQALGGFAALIGQFLHLTTSDQVINNETSMG